MRHVLLFPLLFLVACQTAQQAADDTAEAAERGAEAVVDAAGDAWDGVQDVFDADRRLAAAALVRPTTAPGARAQGLVRFEARGDDLVVQVSLRGLDPGAHGLHIHKNPSCEPADTDGDGRLEPAAASGGHWDPLGTNDHGAPTENMEDKHLGDLGNVTASADGIVETTLTVRGFDPDEYPVAGHAVVVHGGRDDLETDPAGGAGTPQGCGVISGRP